MFRRNAQPKQKNLMLTIKIHKSVNGVGGMHVIDFTANDFQQSWMDFFSNIEELRILHELISGSESLYVLQDERMSPYRKSWTPESSVSDFISSFKRTLPIYRLTISKLRPQGSPLVALTQQIVDEALNAPIPTTQEETQPEPSTPRPVNSLPPKKRPAPPPPTPSEKSVKISKKVFPARSPPPPPLIGPLGPALKEQNSITNPSFWAQEQDENASMAPSLDSQDSRSDLKDTSDEDLRERLIKIVNINLDNNTMLRMQKEIESVSSRGRWMRVARHMPMTAVALGLIFKTGK